MEGPPRLDADLWTPSALGCVGPGELASVASGMDVLYRPLLALHRLPVEGPTPDEGTVEIVAGEEAWDRLCAEADVVVHTEGRPSSLRRDADALVVVVRGPWSRQLRAVLALHPDRLEPRVGEVAMAWEPAGLDVEDRDRLLARGWLTLVGAAADRGLLGVTADVTHTGARQVQALTRHAGFRPVAEAYAAVGLSGTEASVVLDRWTATVAADGRVEVHLERHDDPAARAELAARLARLLARRDADTEPSPPGIEVRVSGPVALDGCRRWGSGAGRESDEPVADAATVDLPTACRSADRWLARWAVEHAP